MATTTVVRPIVRSFAARFVDEAARHVRAGGHAIVWSAEDRALLVVPMPKKGDESDLSYWSILDLGKQGWGRPKTGALRGLATLRVPSDSSDIVRHRAERDSVFPGPTRAMELDCLACGACCKDNEVVLVQKDTQRLERAGLGRFARKPWARRRADGRIVLTLTKDKRCRHLGVGNECGIYTHRPAACSDFPPGSECCLFSREEELGVIDGAATSSGRASGPSSDRASAPSGRASAPAPSARSAPSRPVAG